MIVQLDQVSRQTVGRFTLKLCISVLIASYGKTGYAGTSGWLGLYAIFAAVAALMLGNGSDKSFNHWDEAWWLVAASLGIRIVHKRCVWLAHAGGIRTKTAGSSGRIERHLFTLRN
jgi:hypothetical protein